MVESDTSRMSVLPVAGSKFPSIFLGKVALDVVGLGVGPPCLRLDSEETLLALKDERAEMNCTDPGVTRWTFGGDASSGAVRAFGSRKASGRWITGGKIGRGLVCTTHHGTVRAFGFGDSFGMGAIGTFKLCCD